MKNEPQVGGKAASWLRLAQAGISVPRGFAVAVGAQVDLAAIELDLAQLQERSRATTVAVRSSGVGEDGASLALAGLFESFLDVPAAGADVMEAVLKCRALGGSARAMSAVGRPVPMGVLIQEMIEPTCSGVLFTRDPLGQSTGMVVEAVRGHLARLVDGQQDATRWQLGLEPTPTGFEDLDVKELEIVSRQVEAVLDGPADIEWALAGGSIIVLQARPITTLTGSRRGGLDLIPVAARNADKLPPAVVRHDKIALRLLASKLGIGISQGFVAVATSPTALDVASAAKELLDWGEFIAVLLSPFHLDGEIYRTFGTGETAQSTLEQFVESVSSKHERFAFLLKHLQDTASTGVAVRLPDGRVHIELVHGHFITKGFADPTIYILGPDGAIAMRTSGNQKVAMQLFGGRKIRVEVTEPIQATAAQLAAIRKAAVGLAGEYPGAGVEFGFTTEDEFFLIDLYRSTATNPPDRADVLSHGRVVGTIRVLDLADDAIEKSIDRHVHSRRAAADRKNDKFEILVVKRPLHILDQLVYEATPGTLGFICEGGALLCHLAVVMREHGVPGFILPGATELFTDGDQVILDTRPGSAAAITRVELP